MSDDKLSGGVAAFACLGMVLAIPGVIVLSALINAFVLRQLWAWFVVPTFGLPALTLALAVGLSCITGFLQHHHRDWEKEGETSGEKWGRIIGVLTLKPAMFLLVGYVASRFM